MTVLCSLLVETQQVNMKFALCTVVFSFLCCLAYARFSSQHKDSPPIKRVINGVDAKPNEFPWQVSLQNKKNEHFCAGVILDKDWVIIAAHCIKLADGPITIVAGEHDRSQDSGFEQVRKVDKTIIHEDYNTGTIRHLLADIALLRLKKSLKLNDQVKTIQLPAQGDHDPVGKVCYLTGWGKTIGTDKTSLSMILQKAEVAIAADEDCTRVNQFNNILYFDPPTMICAGAQGKGGCQKDQGGPLSCHENGKWVLRGVMSWGWRKCVTDHYTVFTRMSKFVDWIKSKLATC